MRIIYYFNEVDNVPQEAINRITNKYKDATLIRTKDNDFSLLRKRYNLPEDHSPHLVLINNGILETVWSLQCN